MRSELKAGVSLVLAVLLMAGCSSEETVRQATAEELFAAGMAKFKDEDYAEAYDDFRVITLQYSGGGLADDAQFYMGECKYQREEYITAAYEYDVVIRNMSTSEYVSGARFKRAMCFYHLSPKAHLDQESTRKAIDEFQAFIEYHPTDPRVSEAEAKINELNTKLAKKDYDNGVLYMKMEYYRAAVVYFDNVLEKYHDTPYAEPALLKKGEALYLRKRHAEAKGVIERFLEKYPSSALKGDAESLLRDIQAALRTPVKTQGSGAKQDSTLTRSN